MLHRTTLRRITGLPERTAIPALHLITGLPTVEAMIHLKMLSLLHSMLCSPGPAQEILLRQYAVKTKSSSWTQTMKEILQEYDLPTIADIYEESLSKEDWKNRAKKAVMEHVTSNLEKEAGSKSTLSYLHSSFQPYIAHRSAGIVNSARDVTRIAIKLRLLTGTYLLQKSLFKLKKSPTSQCQLCLTDEEDTTHFLLSCPASTTIRKKYLPAIANIITRKPITQCAPLQILTQLLLDPSHHVITTLFTLTKEEESIIEDVSQKLIYATHLNRSDTLAV